MIVLSLFDGMACGYEALKRAGIKVTKYYASEIDKHAIKIAMKNHPDIIQLGDVKNWHDWDIEKPDLIMGGSPCQGFSFAGNQLAFDDPRSRLFFDMMNIINYHDPKYRLLENTPMKQQFIDVITKCMGVEPVKINSALVSAQNRVRLYWCNWEVTQPLDRGIFLRDILEENDKTKLVRSGRIVGRRINPETGKREDYNKGLPIKQYLEARKDQKAGCITTVKKDSVCIQIGEADIKAHDERKRVYSPDGKSPTLLSASGGYHQRKVAKDLENWRYLTPIEYERLQCLPDNYTEGVSDTQRYNMCGNGWNAETIVNIFEQSPFSKGE